MQSGYGFVPATYVDDWGWEMAVLPSGRPTPERAGFVSYARVFPDDLAAKLGLRLEDVQRMAAALVSLLRGPVSDDLLEIPQPRKVKYIPIHSGTASPWPSSQEPIAFPMAGAGQWEGDDAPPAVTEQGGDSSGH